MARLRELKTRPRSIYRRNPLAEVIAAIKFPRLLTLEERLPVELQEFLKSDYPHLRLKDAVVLSMAVSVNGDEPTPLPMRTRAYEFVSENEKHLVTVSPDGLALTTTAYTQWEDFFPQFVRVLKEFHSIYQPPLITRVGLRYKDTIDREQLELSNVAWDRLLNADLLRPFTVFSEGMNDHPIFAASTVVSLEDAQMRVNYGFIEDKNKHTGFLIDTDCYVDPASFRGVADAASAFEGLHKYTSLAFNACISDELHAALQPTAVPG